MRQGTNLSSERVVKHWLKGARCCVIDWSSAESKRIELSQHQRRKRGTRQPKGHPVPGRLP